jgi:hypothetical protein
LWEGVNDDAADLNSNAADDNKELFIICGIAVPICVIVVPLGQIGPVARRS